MDFSYGTPEKPYGYNLPLNASTYGGDIDFLLGLIHWFMLVLFVVWGGLFAYTLYRFRQSAQPKAGYGHGKASIAIFAAVVIVVFEIWLIAAYEVPTWAAIKEHFPDEKDAMVVEVVAEQFTWNVRYPGADGAFGRRDVKLVSDDNPLGIDRSDESARDDIALTTELHMPVGKPVLVHLGSKDVIHSFFIPVFRIKQDAVPGLKQRVWFEATMTGHWEIACAQLCGLGHYQMKGDVFVHTPEEFDAWMAQKAAELQEMELEEGAEGVAEGGLPGLPGLP